MALVDAKELAQELGFTPKQIRRLAKAGQIPAMKFASEWRFDLEAVKAAGRYVDAVKASAHQAARRIWLRPRRTRA